ncbi:Superfamily II DNA and RNA helicase [Pseudomonas syringae pv. syringae HS191]|nr:Superfamily II DNA and RNA helicase [Pseudomonas syringae pv. syringae HS191]
MIKRSSARTQGLPPLKNGATFRKKRLTKVRISGIVRAGLYRTLVKVLQFPEASFGCLFALRTILGDPFIKRFRKSPPTKQPG